jgi:para-nitrobenzyl esterase
MSAAAPAGAVTALAAHAPSGRPTDPSLVRISDGELRGAVQTDGSRLFADIPYAAAPVGALRWKDPRPEQPWTGVRPATWPGSPCAQAGSVITGGTGSTSEDCLTLNVYTPKAGRDRSRLPVMVFIHGGSFTSGSGSNYNPSVIARRGNVVAVTINYRLGAFGWLVNPALDAESPDGASGDYGLADQQAALRWVQHNIAPFGGNPHNVTIFGESAGAASVCAQLASPAAAGLFQRAVAESGCSSLGKSRAESETIGTTLATQLGCPDAAGQAACLRSKSTAEVLAAKAGSGAGGALPWAPVTGTRVLPRDILTAFRTGHFNRVPVINGTNHDEGTFLVLIALGSYRLTDATYDFALGLRYGDNAAKVLAAYPPSAYSSPTVALAATITDAVFTCPALQDDAALSRRTLTYGYEFDDPDPPLLVPSDFPLGAYHSSELQYVFQRTPVLSLVPRFTPAQLALSDQMIGYWTHFARYGVPSAPGQPHWPEGLTKRVQSRDPAGSHPLTGATVGAHHPSSLWDSLPASL